MTQTRPRAAAFMRGKTVAQLEIIVDSLNNGLGFIKVEISRVSFLLERTYQLITERHNLTIINCNSVGNYNNTD